MPVLKKTKQKKRRTGEGRCKNREGWMRMRRRMRSGREGRLLLYYLLSFFFFFCFSLLLSAFRVTIFRRSPTDSPPAGRGLQKCQTRERDGAEGGGKKRCGRLRWRKMKRNEREDEGRAKRTSVKELRGEWEGRRDGGGGRLWNDLLASTRLRRRDVTGSLTLTCGSVTLCLSFYGKNWSPFKEEGVLQKHWYHLSLCRPQNKSLTSQKSLWSVSFLFAQRGDQYYQGHVLGRGSLFYRLHPAARGCCFEPFCCCFFWHLLTPPWESPSDKRACTQTKNNKTLESRKIWHFFCKTRRTTSFSPSKKNPNKQTSVYRKNTEEEEETHTHTHNMLTAATMSRNSCPDEHYKNIHFCTALHNKNNTHTHLYSVFSFFFKTEL